MTADAAAEEQFGPYLVYERLGVGGMATVHRAVERGSHELERTVALKRLLPHLAEDASFIKSFVREAKLASYLTHVNIVQIYELGRVGTEYFISMEYIDGRDIRRILRHARKATGPPPLHVTVGLLTQLCEALDYAHNKTDEEGHPLGLVHRDVSPSNLLVTTQGHLKVIDFGIAKAQSSALRTQTGRIKGKLAYMAPEAIGGKELDARSDLFAAGVIAHELLTARPLFASKNEYQTLLKVQRGDILPPSTFNQACMPEMDAIVMKALAREPDDRYPSAAAMRDDLVRLRRAHNLTIGVRDIATWIDWAFTLEAPAGFAASTIDQTGASMQVTPLGPSVRDSAREAPPNGGAVRSITPISVQVRAATPRPEDEDAVEIAWGGGHEEGVDAGPLVLDHIPDVSERHLAAPAAATAAGTAQDSLDGVVVHHDEDDIPAIEPSHGVEPRRPGSSRAIPLPRALSQSMAVAVAPGVPSTIREPQPDDTLPGDVPPVHKVPTERMPSMADEPVMSEDLLRASEPLLDLTAPPFGGASPSDSRGLDPLDIPPIVRRPSSQPPLRASSQPPMRASSQPSRPSFRDVDLDDALSRVPRTKPGHQPARRYPTAAVARSHSEVGDSAVTAPRRASSVMIGASIIERQNVRTRWWIPLGLGAIAVAGVGAALYFYVLRDDATGTSGDVSSSKPPPGLSVPVAEVGTVKFVMEPADAEIGIDGKEAHAGSPWSTELPPGQYPIEIHRTGYKAWLTTIELSARETQTMRVVLEPIGAHDAAQATATLVLSTTPAGLEAVLDGASLAQPTPIKIAIHPGAHVVAVRRNGVEVWRQDMSAQADATYEYSPSFTVEKERERLERPRLPLVRREPAPEPREVAPEPTKPSLPLVPTPPPPPTVPPPPPAQLTTAIVQAPPPVVPTPPPVIPPPPPPVAVAPRLIAPNAVTRLSGDAPSFTSSRGSEMPAIVSAKVCIDATGHVTSADVMSKIDHRAASEISDALHTWSYSPYKQAGVATPACFVVAMRTK